MPFTLLRAAILIPVALSVACRGGQSTQPVQTPVEQNAQSRTTAATGDIETKAARFAAVSLTADIAALPDNERQALKKLVEASKLIDTLFLRQVWAGNETMLLDLTA